jgi:surfeit locus 1 family protein
MLRRMREAGLIWPTLVMIPALGLLLGLGFWQMQRKVWKDGLQRQIVERVARPPTAVTRLGDITKTAGGLEYLRVRVPGRFLHEEERLVYWALSAGSGWLVHTPLLMRDGAVVIVNRGWVPDALKGRERRAEGLHSGDVEVVGLVRVPEAPGTFTPANDPARNIWFWRDLAAMSACRNTETQTADCRALEAARRAGFYIDAEALPANPGGWPRGGITNLVLANRHLKYAVTWFGLGATLIGVWIAFVAGRLRHGTKGAAGQGTARD